MKANIYEELRNEIQSPPRKNKKKQPNKKEEESKKVVKNNNKEDKIQSEKLQKEAEQEILKNSYVDPETKEFQKLAAKAKKRREKEIEREKKSPMQTIKQMSIKQRRKMIIIVCLVAYACFLLFGLVNSDFAINENGIAMPIGKSQNEVQKSEEYKLVKNYYDSAQKKYKEILDIDKEIAQNSNTAKLNATRYENYLTWYDNYLTQLKAIEVSSDFLFIKENLVSWAANDICVYLQKISEAFSENNQQKASEAIEFRYASINDFNVITSDMYAVGEHIKGADLKGLDFNPEKYGMEVSEDGVQ